MSALDTLELTDYRDRESFYRVVKGADPAAGAEVARQVEGGTFWVLLGVRVNLVTDATVINRGPSLVITDGNDEVARVPCGAVIAASTTQRLTWFTGMSSIATTGTVSAGPLPWPALKIPAGYTIGTATENLQAGDNYGVPVFWVCQIVQRGERSEIEYELLRTLRRIAIESPYLGEGEQ